MSLWYGWPFLYPPKEAPTPKPHTVSQFRPWTQEAHDAFITNRDGHRLGGPIACECGYPDADRKCICGWWNCADCAADGCHNTRCDRESARIDAHD